MRKYLKILVPVLLVCVIALATGCRATTDGTEAGEDTIVSVQRGSLTIDITAVGNLALSHTADLTFDIAGTVEEVLIEEGDIVTEGQVLATLDISEWEEYLTGLEDQVGRRQRDLLQAEINVKNAEIALEQAQDVFQWPEIREAQVAVDNAESFLEYTQFHLAGATIPEEIEYWENMVANAETSLEIAEDRLEAILVGDETDEVVLKKLQLELTEAQLEDARQVLEDALDELEEANSTTPEIQAPFDGFIIRVNVEGGDEVPRSAVAIVIAEPDKFEVDILVSEMDILQVQSDGEAWVQVDAMSGLTLPAEVTHISPTATIQSGVVNYNVKVEVISLEAVTQERQELRQGMPEITPGEIPERLQQAIDEGRITQEQAEAMLEQIQQGLGSQQGQIPMMAPEEFQLREGLTVTVSIITAQRQDVLLVPNAAITTRTGQAYVQVTSSDGAYEERAIETGISDWQFTEVTEGLNEGEQVLVPQGTVTMINTQPNQQGGMFIPGMGRPR